MKLLLKNLPFQLGMLSALYLYAIAPGKNRQKQREAFRSWNYAHRGLYNNLWKIPENSLRAFSQAVDHHYGIELDVHLTKDHQLAVFHDDTLWRMCHQSQRISETNYNDLKNIHLLDSSEHIPLLTDVLTLVNGRVPIIIELKVDHHNYNELCEAVDKVMADYTGDYCIESFHPLAVRWYRLNRNEVLRGQLSCRFSKDPDHYHPLLFAITHFFTNIVSRPDFIAYHYKEINCFSFAIQHRLFKAMTVLWTVNDLNDYSRLKKAGHTIIFEDFYP